MMKFKISILFALLVAVFALSGTAHAAAPANIINFDSTHLAIIVTTAATGTNFLNFVDSGTTTANPADLTKVTYNGVHPTSGEVNSSSVLLFVFPLSMGTGKSGGPITILANTYQKVDHTNNIDISVANGAIADAAVPFITVVSIASSGNNPAYAKVGDTITLTFTATEELDSVSDEFDSGGDITTDSNNGDEDIENPSDNTWTISYVANSADTQGLVTFSIVATDLSSNESDLVDTTTDASSVTFDKTAPTISEITPVATPSGDTTPDYVFNTDQTGTLSYGGDCSSSTTIVSSFGPNTITFDTLAAGTHANCTVILTDDAGNASNTLAVTSFTITAPPVTPTTPSPTPSSIGGGYTTNPNDLPPSAGGIIPVQPPAELPPSAVCTPYLTAFLKMGDSAADVSKLQSFLKTQGLFTFPTITGFFGPITFQAVKDFQQQYAAEILAPLGLTAPTGIVREMTLAKINTISCVR